MKGILVIDEMPRSCFSCQFRGEDDLCLANGLKDEDRSLYCPLKPIPKKVKSASEYGSNEEYTKHLINWKKEIDEILGEEK